MQKLYIIHGWTYNIAPWEQVAKQLQDLGVETELLLVPGLTAPSKKVWTITQYVDWAEQNLPKNAIALGHSNGGRILLNLINRHPDKLSALILLDSAGIYEFSLKRKLMSWLARIFSPLKNIKPLRKVFHRLIGASDYAKAPKNMKKTLQNMLDSDKQLKISSDIPAHIIWGEQDKITPLRQAQKIAKGLKNSKLIIKKQWGHSPYLKDPAALAEVIAKEYLALTKATGGAKK